MRFEPIGPVYASDQPVRGAQPTAQAPMQRRGREYGRKRPVGLARLLLEAEAVDWMRDGNCIGVDPELFYPERGASTREAKAVCRECTVREQCLDYALETGEKFGIWGGLSERERRRIRRRRADLKRRGLVA